MNEAASFAVSSDGAYAYVEAAVRTLAREGVAIRQTRQAGRPSGWAHEVAGEVGSGAVRAAVLFCLGPELAACVANKVPGVRAVSVSTVAQAGRAALDVGVNLLAVEMPGRTYYEIRQMLRILFSETPSCPAGLSAVLKEVEGHAHR